MKPPRQLYRSSQRALPRSLPEQRNGDEREQHRLRTGGGIKWGVGMVFVSEAFAGDATC